MELSEEIQGLLQKYKTSSPRSNDTLSDIHDDVIDVDLIDFGDEETWLMEAEASTEDCEDEKNGGVEVLGGSPKKHFDSRTFTRPKKKTSNRPSIEKFNEEYFEKNSSGLSDEIDNFISSAYKEEEVSSGGLQFDLSQPTSGAFFDRILASAGELDSFTNMSPPSLVNSMCSSTFTNLMESSIIKNDPVLRQIRDEDYNDDLIFHETDALLYQSFTESCSSINSDTAEKFLRRTLNGTFNLSSESFKTADDVAENSGSMEGSGNSIHELHTENIDPNITVNIPQNHTFRKSSRLNATYEKISDEPAENFDRQTLGNLDRKSVKIRDNLNNTYQRDVLNKTFDRNSINATFRKEDQDDDDDDLNRTHTLALPITNALNATYDRRLSRKQTPLVTVPTPDKLNATITIETEKSDRAKTLEAEIAEYLNETMNVTYEKGAKEFNDPDAGSSDSLDRTSSVSGGGSPIAGSRGASRNMLMSEVDAIVEEQERSLQVMSTPKPAKSMSRLFDNACISPILIKGNLSDSEISSEEYQTVRSAISAVPERASLDRHVKSMSNLKQPAGMADVKPRGVNTVSSNLHSMRPSLRGSYGSLRGTYGGIRGSYGSLSENNPRVSNLRGMNTQLKGSYTSLRPTNQNLPNIPPPNRFGSQLNVTVTKKDVFKEPAPPSANGTFLKPLNKLSSLPRPVSSATGIPRSKIPAPKSIRSSSGRTTSIKPTSKSSLNEA